MSSYIVHQLDSEAFMKHAREWNDLWERSDVSLPTARAEFVSLASQHYFSHAKFVAVVVECNGKYVAALPIVIQKYKKLFRMGFLPNKWRGYVDLLLDPNEEGSEAIECLVASIQKIPLIGLSLDHIPFDEKRWVSFRHALGRSKVAFCVKQDYEVGLVSTEGSWDGFLDTWTHDERKMFRRREKAFTEGGGVHEVCERLSPIELEKRLREGFEVERRSWKGEKGTAILQDKAEFQFYQREADLLNKLGELELSFLDLKGKQVGFSYAYRAKKKRFGCKIAYDPEFRKEGPGKQLTLFWLRRSFEDPLCQEVDFHGPLESWYGSLPTSRYAVGSLTVSNNTLAGRLLFGRFLINPFWNRKGPKTDTNLAFDARSMREYF